MDEEEIDLSAEGKNYDETEMDMTPMVDVTFLLLIFFMVTASFSLQKSHQLPTPQESEAPSTNVKEPEETESEVVEVYIDSTNTFRVVCGDFEAECPSDQELFVQLRAARNAQAGEPANEMKVKAHRDCLHQKVVTALDAASLVGMEKVQLETTEEDD